MSTPSKGISTIPEKEPLRVIVERVAPQIDGGRFPIKRTVGEEVVVEADIFADGHDVLAAALLYRPEPKRGDSPSAAPWLEAGMSAVGNDRWQGRFRVEEPGVYEYTVTAWIDRFATWRHDLSKKTEAGQRVASELLEGAGLVARSAKLAAGDDGERLQSLGDFLAEDRDESQRVAVGLGEELATLMIRYPDRRWSVSYEPTLKVLVDPERARHGAWYEMFPRSSSPTPGRHGTFRDAERRLPYVAGMGFDVLYLPPIHPIGRTARKGPNNTLNASPEDPGSPWAIGGPEGGYRSVHPDLGTLEDFDRFVAAAESRGLQVALDVAWQCSPDHPYVREHSEWFSHGPDGSIKYAENPPKKYQDIYPLNFECDHWRELWQELKEVVLFWIDHNVRIFRVDNPHTKAFRFWEWLIAEVRREHPETIFLAEAFTRPKVMRHLAKAGFSQSYTYFTWRNTKEELTEYLTELTQSEVREYMRPNFFANTPDILHEYLQFGGPPAFRTRLVLAATLSATYGIYGPPFELCERTPIRPGSEEYLDSEKYQVRHWELDRPDSLRDFIARVNEIRRENPALHDNWNLRFFPVDNDQLIFYVKATPDLSNIVFVVVNLDPHHLQSGWVHAPLQEFGLPDREPFQVHDLITDARYLWHGERNFVRLDPQECPAHVLRVRRRIKTERDFDYYM